MSLSREKLKIHSKVLRKRFNAEGASIDSIGISYIVSLDFDIPSDRICDFPYKCWCFRFAIQRYIARMREELKNE